MEKSNIYTGGGDKGKTSLVSGTRVSKGDDRLELYGGTDGLNSQIGLLSCKLAQEEKVFDADFEILNMIQNKLFDIGSMLACEKDFHETYKLPTVSEENIKTLEHAIDQYDSFAGKINYFILPGGSVQAALAHTCRTECRRIERAMVRFNMKCDNEVNENIMVFMNRLSDFFFAFARYINKKLNFEEKKWERC